MFGCNIVVNLIHIIGGTFFNIGQKDWFHLDDKK